MKEADSQNKTPVGTRNYALDLLRILCMIMIVMLHQGSHGGMLARANELNANGILVHFVQALCTVGVNCFVLISGYFLVNERFRFSKLWSIIAETLFYSWLIFFLCRLNGIPAKSLRQAIFPISFAQNWFITAYVGMYLLFPIVNYTVHSMNQKQHRAAIAACLIPMMLWSDVIPSADPFGANGGYTVVWFLVLYLIASYIRLYGAAPSSKRSALVYLLCGVITLLTWAAIHCAYRLIPSLASHDVDMYYYRYNATPILAGSVALFILFLHVRIENRFLIRLIGMVAPLTMGVYLIHDNPNVRPILWNQIVHTQDIPVTSPLLVPRMLLIGIAVFAVCAALDEIRLLVFRQIQKISFYRSFLNHINEKISRTIYAKIQEE